MQFWAAEAKVAVLGTAERRGAHWAAARRGGVGPSSGAGPI